MSKTDKRENIIMVPLCAIHTFVHVADTEAYRLQVSRSRLRKVGNMSCGCESGTEIPLRRTADWMEIRTNHMVVITPKMNLLQIPIVDKFYVKPSDPTASSRGIEFAAAKGFLSPRRDSVLAH